jgi:phosphoribosylanthranilate isomerase
MNPMTDPAPTTPRLELLPAVDVAAGKAVRLYQGQAGSETSYGDPLAAALEWQDSGAEWIHLVDLDAAFGRGSNAEILAGVVGAVDIKVEMSGGIRDEDSLERALATGCVRVNLGTAALEDPEWAASAIGRYGDRIAVGLDVRGETLAARGWTREGGNLWEVLTRLEDAGCARYVVTDVTKDGTLHGPNLGLLKDVCAAFLPWTTSPGSGPSCPPASRGRSSARPCMRGRSRCPTPSTPRGGLRRRSPERPYEQPETAARGVRLSRESSTMEMGMMIP